MLFYQIVRNSRLTDVRLRRSITQPLGSSDWWRDVCTRGIRTRGAWLQRRTCGSSLFFVQKFFSRAIRVHFASVRHARPNTCSRLSSSRCVQCVTRGCPVRKQQIRTLTPDWSDRTPRPITEIININMFPNGRATRANPRITAIRQRVARDIYTKSKTLDYVLRRRLSNNNPRFPYTDKNGFSHPLFDWTTRFSLDSQSVQRQIINVAWKSELDTARNRHSDSIWRRWLQFNIFMETTWDTYFVYNNT